MTTTTHDKELEAAVDTIQRFVRSMVPGSISGDQALSYVSQLARAERAASSGIALLSPVVKKEGAYTKQGHATAADWLGAVSGSSAGTAKGRLMDAEQAADSPEIWAALRHSKLSPDQLKIVSKAVSVGPGAAGELLDLVERGASNQELGDTARRQQAAARKVEDERHRRERVHARRHFRWHQAEGGGIRGEFTCDEVEWAKVAPALEAEAQARWKAAGGAGGASLDAHRLDAFLDMLAGAGGGAGVVRSSRVKAVVVVSAESLRRGTTQGDELCEIEGVGPVSVAAAVDLIGCAGLQFVIRDGIDIRTVTGTSRHVSDRLDVALLVRDRHCSVPGCGKRHGLEQDHCQVDFGDGGPTELDNLARLCQGCHGLKTNGGWHLGGVPGRRTWDPPVNPPGAGAVARRRKVAAAKGKAARNLPRRT